MADHRGNCMHGFLKKGKQVDELLSMTDVPAVLLPTYAKNGSRKGISEYHPLIGFISVQHPVQRTSVEWMVISISDVR